MMPAGRYARPMDRKRCSHDKDNIMPSRPGYPTVTPYLVCNDAASAIAWYGRHMDARERLRLLMKDGRTAHAELEIGDSVIMMADEFPEWNIVSPKTLEGTPVSLSVYVDDVDTAFAAMLADGATELDPVANQFHGDRAGKLADPFGHHWHVGTNIRSMTPEEIQQAFEAMIAKSEQ